MKCSSVVRYRCILAESVFNKLIKPFSRTILRNLDRTEENIRTRVSTIGIKSQRAIGTRIDERAFGERNVHYLDHRRKQLLRETKRAKNPRRGEKWGDMKGHGRSLEKKGLKKERKKENQGWRVSVGWNFPCPTAPHPPSFEHRGRRDKKKEQKAEAARRAHARTRLVRACYRWHAWYARASRRGKLCSRFVSNLHPCACFNTRNILVSCRNSSRTGVEKTDGRNNTVAK